VTSLAISDILTHLVIQACVDSGRNVLGVCCVDLVVMLTGQGRPVRQDDVFKVESSIDLDTARQSGEDLGPFVVINIAADNANIDSDVRDNKGLFRNCAFKLFRLKTRQCLQSKILVYLDCIILDRS